MVGARGLVPVGHSGALAQEQGPVVAEVVMIPGVLHRLDLKVLRGVPGNGQLSVVIKHCSRIVDLLVDTLAHLSLSLAASSLLSTNTISPE